MGHQIIRQPDGKLCAFSTESDTIVLADATPKELADRFAQDAAREARSNTRRIAERVLSNQARSIYYQLTMAYAEAVEEHRRHEGDPDMIQSEEGQS